MARLVASAQEVRFLINIMPLICTGTTWALKPFPRHERRLQMKNNETPITKRKDTTNKLLYQRTEVVSTIRRNALNNYETKLESH